MRSGSACPALESLLLKAWRFLPDQIVSIAQSKRHGLSHIGLGLECPNGHGKKCKEAIRMLLGSELLANCRYLSLHLYGDAGICFASAVQDECADLSNVRALTLQGSTIDSDLVVDVMSSKMFEGLWYLSVRGTFPAAPPPEHVRSFDRLRCKELAVLSISNVPGCDTHFFDALTDCEVATVSWDFSRIA